MKKVYLMIALVTALLMFQAIEVNAQSTAQVEYLTIYYNSADYKSPKLIVYYPDGKTEELVYKDVPTGMTNLIQLDQKLAFYLSQLLNKLGKEGWQLKEANGFVYFLERKLN